MADLESRLENPASEKAAAYLEFEDFSHTGLGLETYEDGLQHPIELRRILTGDLRYFSNSSALSLILIISFVLITNHFSLEMSVSFQARADDVFQTLDYPSKKKKGVGSISTFSFFIPQICCPRPPNVTR